VLLGVLPVSSPSEIGSTLTLAHEIERYQEIKRNFSQRRDGYLLSCTEGEEMKKEDGWIIVIVH